MAQLSNQIKMQEELRRQYTVEHCTAANKKSIDALIAGLLRPPRVLESGHDRPSKLIPGIVDAVTEEIGWQQTACVYTCVIWKDEAGTLATAEAYSLPDLDLTVDWDNSAVLHHFTHFALQRGGLGFGLSPEDAYPVPWPDFDMQARPALPPIHPNWEEEKWNLIEWFTYLWRTWLKDSTKSHSPIAKLHAEWQGGDEEPDWEKIVSDINDGRFRYIEQKHLLAPFLPFMHPDTWGEGVTWSWSRHVRSTMDEWGRVLRSKGDTVMQFRLIDDRPTGEDAIVCETFMGDIHPDSQLIWPTLALLFEKQVKRAIQVPAPLSSEQAALLYDNAATLLQEAEARVPGITSLCDKLRAYEASFPPETPATAGNGVESTWHLAVASVHQDPKTFGRNWNREHIQFPSEFVSQLQEGHHSWAVTALRDWLKTNPFWDEEAGGLLGGFGGIAIAFYTILHYAINILRVAPKDDDEEDSMVERNLQVYGQSDYRVLAQCTHVVEDQINKSARKHPHGLRQVDTDRSGRFAAWNLERWVQFDADGDKDDLPEDHLTAPPYNVFETKVEPTEHEGSSRSHSEVSIRTDPSGVDVDARKEIEMIDLADVDSDGNLTRNSGTEPLSKGGPNVRSRTGAGDARSENALDQIAAAPQSRHIEQSGRTAKTGASELAAGDVTMSDVNASLMQMNNIAAQSTPAPTTRQKHAGDQERSGVGHGAGSESANTRDARLDPAGGQRTASALNNAGGARSVPDGLPEQAVDLLGFARLQTQARTQSSSAGGGGDTKMQHDVGAGGATVGSSGCKGAGKASSNEGGRAIRGTKRTRNKACTESGVQEISKRAK